MTAKKEYLKNPENKKRFEGAMIWIRKQGFETISDFARSFGGEYTLVSKWIWAGRKPRPIWARTVLAIYPDCPFVKTPAGMTLATRIRPSRNISLSRSR